MKDSTKDQAIGKLHEVKGKLKEATGVMLDNPALELEGIHEKVEGKLQGKVGQIEKILEK